MSENDNNGPQKRRNPTNWTALTLIVQLARFIVDLVRLFRDWMT